MILNDIQKVYLNNLNLPLDDPNRIKDLNSFFALKCDIEKEIDSCPWATGSFNPSLTNQNIYGVTIDKFERVIGGMNHCIYFKNNEQVLYNTTYFLELIDFLEQEKLITYIDKAPDEIANFKVPVLKTTIIIGVHDVHKIDDRLWFLIKEFVLCEFVPLQEKLNEFIKNDYKIKEEVLKDSEVNDRKHQLKITQRSLNITIAALCVSILVNIFTIIEYSTNRNISIIKDITKSDTTKVKILNNALYDTIKIYDTVKVKNNIKK